MALKSRQWFQGECYTQVKGKKSLAELANRAMELGLSNRDNTTGHVLQAVGAVQVFFAKFPEHLRTVQKASTQLPYALIGTILTDWLTFFSEQRGTNGRKDFGYNWDTLRNILTTKYGGRVTGGGGGDNEFEIVFRLVAGFLE